MSKTWAQAKKECGVNENFPYEAKRMFLRRYDSVLKRTEDPNKAKNRAMSFVKTRYKKVKGKWQPRQKS